MELKLAQRLNAVPTALVIPGYAFIHGALTWIGAKAVFDPRFLAPFWPASGLLVGILLLQPLRRWPAWIGAALLAHAFIPPLVIRGGWHPPIDFAFAALSLLGTTLAAALAGRWVADRRPAERPLQPLGGVLLAAFTAPLLTGFMSAQLSVLLGSPTPFFLIWRSWWAAEALGIIAVAPLVFAWSLGTRSQWLDSRWRLAEVALSATALLTVTQLVCAQPSGMSYTIVFVVPFFIWLGLRSDARTIATIGLGSLGLAIHHTMNGTGPFITGPLSDESSALALHALYGSLIPGGLAIAHLVEHQRVLQIRCALAELLLELLTYLVDLNPDELRASIKQALTAVGEFTGADRCKLMLFRAGTVRLFARWARVGAVDNAEHLDGQPTTNFPWAMAKLNAGQELNFEAADLAEQVSPSERNLYATLDAGAFRVLPLFDGDELIGAVSLAWTHSKPRADSDRMSLLPVATQLFASGLRRARAQEELAVYQDRLRTLASELSLAEERVRRATAVHLHDSIGQSLAVARIKLGQLLQQRSDETLKQLREILDEAIGHTRNIIADLSPPVLYELGLIQAIRWLADREHRRSDFQTEITEIGTPGDLSEESKVALFQCYRELLANVVKHAHAASVLVSVHWLENQVEVAVEDDGVGFRTSEKLSPTPSGGRFGLFSVRERIRSRGGHFSIESVPGIGTKVRISMPMRRQRMAV